MNWAWATSLDQLWRSPTFPMWLTLAAAAFFGVLVLITLLRAEKSVANGALTVITLLAVGVAVAATIRTFGADGRCQPFESFSAFRSVGKKVSRVPERQCSVPLQFAPNRHSEAGPFSRQAEYQQQPRRIGFVLLRNCHCCKLYS